MSNIERYPLSQLALSPINARSKRKPSDIEEMAASLKAHGQLQNLVGHKEKGKILIAAGGTRLDGFNLLAERDEITPDHSVSVLVTSKAKAAEASLAENTQRQDMHPADQLNAFEALLSTKSPDDIAASFGFSLAHVRRILKLTGVSPMLREAFAIDKVSLDAMQALSAFEDHATQEAVFEQCGNTPGYIKQLWRARGTVGSDAKAAFIGEQAYVSAGGQIERDIFTGDVVFKDPELLDTLVENKLSETAETLRAEGWAWVEYESSFYPVYPNREEPAWEWVSDAREAEAAELLAILKAAEEATDCEEPPEGAFDRLREAEDAVEAHESEHKLAKYSAEQIARSGATYVLTRQGLRLERGILKTKASQAGADEADRDTQPAPKAMPDTVKETLCRLHVLAVQERVGSDPKAALAIFIADQVKTLPLAGSEGHCEFGFHYNPATSPCQLRVDPYDGEQDELIAASPVYDRLQRRGTALVEDAPALASVDDVLPWLYSLDMERLLSMFAFVMARSINTPASGRDESPLCAMQAALGFDVRDAIDLDFDNFYSRLKRPQLEGLLADNDASDGINPKWKQKELAQYAADTLTAADFQHPYFG